MNPPLCAAATTSRRQRRRRLAASAIPATWVRMTRPSAAVSSVSAPYKVSTRPRGLGRKPVPALQVVVDVRIRTSPVCSELPG
jgi:hypothetical protein